MNKFTKRQMYTALINLIENGSLGFVTDDGEVKITAEELVTFATNEIELLDKKASKAKERKATKAKEADALTIALEELLTDEFETIADIAARVDMEDVSVAKCTYRLNSLVENGVAEKTDMKIAEEGKKTRTVKGYRRAQ